MSVKKDKKDKKGFCRDSVGENLYLSMTSPFVSFATMITPGCASNEGSTRTYFPSLMRGDMISPPPATNRHADHRFR